MKVLLLVLLMLSTLATTSVFGQGKPKETAEELELQLIDVRAREEVARLQLSQLEESMKPENIERSLAGIGSTRPEELRERRRRQLAIEKTTLAAQLEQLTAKRAQLETALEKAKGQAYLESASDNPAFENAFGIGLAKSSLLIALLVVGGVSLATMSTFVIWGHYVVKAHRCV